MKQNKRNGNEKAGKYIEKDRVKDEKGETVEREDKKESYANGERQTAREWVLEEREKEKWMREREMNERERYRWMRETDR